MKRLTLLSVALFAIVSTGCSNHEHTYELVVHEKDTWHTFLEGEDFKTDGIEVCLKCKHCDKEKEVEYTLENNENLTIGQKSVTFKYEDYTYEYPIQVKNKYKIACVGDSLTAGHYWADKSYPSYLSKIVSDKYEVGNFGVNGISITGYGGSFSSTAPNQRYIKQDVYKNCVDFDPDIFAIMLGTNDATEWDKAEPTFLSEYRVLLDSFKEQFPFAHIIMMVSPPVVSPNQFSIPNDKIRDYVNPIQRQLADEYILKLIDLRNDFEDTPNFETEFLRPNDNVHFTEKGAEFVANKVWNIAKDLRP